MSRRRAPANRCEFQIAVWGPHPGCREYMSDPEFLSRCRAPATHVLKRDTEPAFVAPTYPPPRRHRPDPCCPTTGRVRERVRVCGEHVNELHNPTGSSPSRVYRFRVLPSAGWPMNVLYDRAGHPYTDLGYTLAYLTPCRHAHARIDEHGVLNRRACFHEARCAAGPTSVDLHPPRR